MTSHAAPHARCSPSPRAARAAVAVQAAWRRYRTYVLVRRYGMLMYVREFRAWNPSLRAFLARARL